MRYQKQLKVHNRTSLFVIPQLRLVDIPNDHGKTP